MNKLITFIKNEVVLSVAIILAIISSFFVTPDVKYISYIDFRTLVILFVLMVVVAGIEEQGLFHQFAHFLLSKTKKLYQIIMVLVLLCFFFSMFITNDVALITFVPLTFIVLDMLGEEKKYSVVAVLVVMQTIAANMGSMMTPLGNPQNLYLYVISKISFVEFVVTMLPYSLGALVILIVWILIYCRFKKENGRLQVSLNDFKQPQKTNKVKMVVYIILTAIIMLSVFRIINYWIVFAIVLITVFFMDRDVFKKVDYSLLFTFTAFFVFIGNIGRIDVFSSWIEKIIEGREIMTSIIVSQVTSNVPAALLLSEFSDEYHKLIIGINLGGLGTLIASMASLISFRLFANEKGSDKGRYFATFTVASLVFLALLLGLYAIRVK